MGKIDGRVETEIEAPIAAVFAVAADIEGSPRWQPQFKLAECIERDGKDQVLVRMETEAKALTLNSVVRFEYEAPARIAWRQEEGDLKSVEGSWEFEDLGDGRTRASYWMEVDLGRRLGLLVRGPVVSVLRGHLVDSMAEQLKDFVEDQA